MVNKFRLAIGGDWLFPTNHTRFFDESKGCTHLRGSENTDSMIKKKKESQYNKIVYPHRRLSVDIGIRWMLGQLKTIKILALTRTKNKI